TRTSQEAQTSEPRRIRVPDLVIETGNIHVVKIQEPQVQATAVPIVAATPQVDEKEKKGEEIKKLIERAEAEKKSGRMHDALATYKSILTQDPENVEAMINMGEILFDLDRSKESLEMLEKATQTDPKNPRPYLTLGTIYMMRN